MKRFPVSASVGVVWVVTACAPTMIPPREPSPPADHYVRAPLDTVWQRIVTYFADSRIPIQTIDRGSGLIASTRFQLPLSLAESWADCGRASTGEPTLAKLRAINNLPTFTADFNVLVRARGDSTAVRSNIGSTATARSPAGLVPIRGVSTGELEKESAARVAGTR